MTMVASHPLGHSALNVRVHRRDGRRLIVEPIGDVDGAVSSEVEALVSLVVACEPARVDIDLRPVAFIDLGGLRAVGRMVDELRARGSRVSSCRVDRGHPSTGSGRPPRGATPPVLLLISDRAVKFESHAVLVTTRLGRGPSLG